MTTSKTNALSYILAAISLLLILFYSFSAGGNARYFNIYSIFMINVINIFIQAHGNSKIFSIISSILVLIEIMPYFLLIVFDNPSYWKGLPITFYLIFFLLMIQLILPAVLLIIEKVKKQNRTEVAV